jgi:uncharacterized tellurite resistance protein B-like protein
MSQNGFVLDMAKLVIVAAWADGELANDEVNALKDLLFKLEEVSGDDWAVLRMYMESPVSEAEAEALLGRVLGAIRSETDKRLALETLEALFHSDGEVTVEEETMLAVFRGEIAGVETGLLAGLTRSLKVTISKRSEAVAASCLREHATDDYVNNTVFYDLSRREAEAGIQIDRPEDEVRKLCLVAGLMSRIAWVDKEIAAEEKVAMREVLMGAYGLSGAEADLLVDLSCSRAIRGLDHYRLCQNFFDCTTIDERRAFLKVLFRIADAADNTSHDEIEEIRAIACGLKLSHQDFIDAKVTVV